jgi:hypothetical protein
MPARIHHLSEVVIGSSYFNKGNYAIDITPLSPRLFSVSLSCRRSDSSAATLGAWGYASTEAEAQELGETLESLFQMRFEHMQYVTSSN